MSNGSNNSCAFSTVQRFCASSCSHFLPTDSIFIFLSNELCQFKEKFGHCDAVVRKGLEEYKQLASWTGLQRRKYKAKQTGTKAGRTSEITDEQIKKLAAIGFKFSLQDDFETRFKNLLEL